MSAIILLPAGRCPLARRARERATGGRWAPWWGVLSVGFHLLSLDEVVALHEYLNSALGQTSWTDVGIAGAGLVFLAFLPFWWALEPRLR